MIETVFHSIDWELFSLAATPIISFLAFLIYGAALFTSIKQNRITTSASLIPYYEEEIEDLRESGSKIELKNTDPASPLNGLNFAQQFMSALIFLNLDMHYKADIEEGNFNAIIKIPDLKKKTYGSNLLFLNQFFNEHSEISQHLRSLEILIQNIENSELTISHKKILKFKIRKKLALPFIIIFLQIRWEKNFPKEIPATTLLDYDAKEHLVLWQLEETPFMEKIRHIEKSLTLN